MKVANPLRMVTGDKKRAPKSYANTATIANPLERSACLGPSSVMAQGCVRPKCYGCFSDGDGTKY